MNILALAVIMTTLTTVAALALGICSMVRNDEIAHFDSEHWRRLLYWR